MGKKKVIINVPVVCEITHFYLRRSKPQAYKPIFIFISSKVQKAKKLTKCIKIPSWI